MREIEGKNPRNTSEIQLEFKRKTQVIFTPSTILFFSFDVSNLVSCTRPLYLVMVCLWPPPRLLPDHQVYMVSECSLSVENTSVKVEVTSFEPTQNLLITWSFKVCI